MYLLDGFQFSFGIGAFDKGVAGESSGDFVENRGTALLEGDILF